MACRLRRSSKPSKLSDMFSESALLFITFSLMIYLMKVKRFCRVQYMNDVRRLKKKQDGAMSSEMMGDG